MKPLQALCLLILLTGCVRTPRKHIVFFGDSITQLAVTPGGFITKIDSMLKRKGYNNYELTGAGVNGNKVYDLYQRMDADVLDKDPDLVIILIGVNDVWHKSSSEIDVENFEKFYNAVLKKLLDRDIKDIICTPAVIGEKNGYSSQQDDDLDMYSNIIRGIAAKNNLPMIDLRKIFKAYDVKNNPENTDRGILTKDGIHLNEAGNQLVANEMMKVILQ